MPEYVPVSKPGQAVTKKASVAIVGGQVVAVTGSDTVGPATANAVSWLGVAANDAAVNDSVTVYSGGEQEPVASGAVTAGDIVACAAAGRVATSATPAVGQSVGVAVRSAVDGAKVRVRFNR